MEKIKVEAYLHGMDAGEITELEYRDNVFVLKKQTTYVKKAKKDVLKPIPIATFLETDQPDRGEKIAMVGNNSIYENVVKAVKESINQDKSRLEIIDEIGTYYPQSKPISCVSYYSAYLRYIKNPIPNTKPFRTYKKRKPKNALCFDETYKTWILKEEHERIKKALYKWNFVATATSVMKETGLSLRRVNATLHYMRKKNQVFVKKENKVPIYKPTF